MGEFEELKLLRNKWKCKSEISEEKITLVNKQYTIQLWQKAYKQYNIQNENENVVIDSSY